MLTPLDLSQIFDDAECAEIIRIAELRQFSDGGLVRGESDAGIRRARIAWLDESNDAAWVFNRLVDTVITANRDHFAFDLTQFSERMQVAWYDADKRGHFDWHADIGDGPFAAKRKLSFVAQLSCGNAYGGGALELNTDGHVRAVSRDQGSGILFPSFALHRVTPVTRGHRYSLATWIHGPDFR